MADENAPQGEAQEQDADSVEKNEVDWKAESRKWESRAKENLANAKRNEEAAQRLQEIEQAQKSEAEKAQERLNAAEKRAAELEVKALRADIAAAKGVPAALLVGSTQEQLEASADALIEFRGAVAKGPVIPNQGKQPEKAAENADDWLRAAARKA